MTRGKPRYLAVLLLPALALTAAVAQEEGDGYTFFETLDVEVVNVEVVVTDADGEPVHGLTREDFELTEDGIPMEITNFYSVEAEGPDPEAAREALPAAPAARPNDHQLHLAVFVDGTTLAPLNRRRAFDAVREFFDRELVRPTSLVLATYDGALEVTRLEETDPARRDDYVAILEKAASRGGIDEITRRSILTELDRASLDPMIAASEASGILGSIEAYAGQQYNRTIQSMQALGSFVEALAGLPGRKALLYVSGGLPRNPGEALYYAWDNKFGAYAAGLGVSVTQRARELDTGPELLALSRHANANRVTFYSIGAGRGGGPGGGISAEEGSFDVRAMGTAGGGRNWTAGLEAIDNSNLGGTLEELAAATGGRSMTNSYNFGKLFATLNRDLSSYYSLGYTPLRERDGKNHRLKVQVRGRKVDVRHREHYRELTREEIMSGRTRSALLLGGGSNPLEIRTQFGRVAEDEQGRFLVPVMVKVPLAKLVLVPREEAHVGRIGIFLSARDGRGRVSPVKSMDVPIRIPNEKLLEALGQVAGYRLVLLMRPEEHSIAVAVRDELGQVESTVMDLWSPPAPAG